MTATPTSRPPISGTRRSGVSARRLKKPLSMSSARVGPVLIIENIPPGGALERAPCLGQEDVVERRSMQPQISDRNALGVERAHDLGQVAEALRQARGHAVGRGGRLLAEACQHVGYASAIAGLRRDRL